jgi:hypothetical protein
VTRWRVSVSAMSQSSGPPPFVVPGEGVTSGVIDKFVSVVSDMI